MSLFWISLNLFIRFKFQHMKKEGSQFTNSEHMHTHRWVIHIGGSYGQPGVILNEDRWRWIPASQLSVCGSREQNEMHFLCITQCCIPLISLHFILTSVLLLQYSYITAPSLLFSQIQFQIQFQCNYYLVTLYQSGLFLWCFYSAFFTCGAWVHHLFL